MKILLIDVNCKKGSTGKIAYDIYSALIAGGHQAAICYGRGPFIGKPNIYKFGIDTETCFHAAMTRITGFTGCFSFFSTRRLLRYIKTFQPDVVHIHELHGYFVNIKPVVNYLKRKNIKTVWTFHCEFMYTGRCGYTYECERWKIGCGNCKNLNEYPATKLFDFSHNMYKEKRKLFNGFDNLTIVTPSKWLADNTKQSFLKDKRIEVIHNGIETNTIFYPRKFENLRQKHNLTNERVILAVAPGIMLERKGGKWVLDLAQEMKEDNVKVILVGVDDLSQPFPDNVIALARTQNQDELAEYYSMADVFIICSVMENFPTVCLEALCCGTPVVGFDCGGTAETAPAPYGEFVKYGEIQALKAAILSMLKKNIEPWKCAEFGKMQYDKTIMYENYKKLYL